MKVIFLPFVYATSIFLAEPAMKLNTDHLTLNKNLFMSQAS